VHVIWKRPDGFHGASPDDYKVVELGDHSKLWLHRQDHDQFPFRVSGGWEEKEATVRLNNFINLLDQEDSKWLERLNKLFDHSMKDDKEKYLSELQVWLGELKDGIKGDTWETEILEEALRLTSERLNRVSQRFLGNA